MTRFRFPAALLTLTLACATPALAESFTVDRCSSRGDDGVWRPELVANIGREKFRFKIGENGLTTQIAYNRQKAVAYVRKALAPRATGGNYSICGDFSFARDRISTR